MSSSDFPAVSGISFHTISIYGIHIAANKKKVPAEVRFSSNQGVSCPIRYVPTQRDNPATDIAKPRILVGYISDKNTNITALIEAAVKNMYARKNIKRKMLDIPHASPFMK